MKISIKALSFKYNTRPVLNDIDLEIDEGEILILVGPNGSGKTTLLKNLSRVLAPSHGEVYIDFKRLSELSRAEVALEIAAVEQDIQPGFEFTVQEMVELGRFPHTKRLQILSARDRSAVTEAMAATDVLSFAARSVFSLSSGERQRVWLAMAMAQEPRVLLLDEPTAHLDINYQIAIMEIISELAGKGLTVLMTVHDLSLAAAYGHRIALLHEGRITAAGSPDEVLTEEAIERVFKAKVSILKNGTYLSVVPRIPAYQRRPVGR